MIPAKKLTKTEYNTIHQWNLRNWVKNGSCDFCKQKTKTHWSNKSGNYIRRDKTDWQELCVPCHSKYDRENFGETWHRGRPKKQKSLLFYNYYANELIRLRSYAWFNE